MTTHLATVISPFLLLVIAFGSIPATAVLLRLAVAIVDARPLWEPRWKREAREFAAYVPVADDWGW